MPDTYPMDQFIHADIFFFVSTIAVTLITLGLIAALIYIIRILKDVDHLTARARVEVDSLGDDLDALRNNLRAEGSAIRRALRAVFGVFGTKPKVARRKPKSKSE
ncbi:MAG: hypothetical protein HY978_04675 [Candidatus Liptonbacteria bacterium]|nr:hypothetical protein [Candidatus Liptonbacteria bacterium]